MSLAWFLEIAFVNAVYWLLMVNFTVKANHGYKGYKTSKG